MNNIQKHIAVLCLFLLLRAEGYSQQGIQFTQYIFNSMAINPAYTGYKEVWYGQMGMRSQFSGWEGAPYSGSLTVDGVLGGEDKRHGVGLQLSGETFGAESTVDAYANYAFRLKLSDDDAERLSLGIAAGMTQYGLNGTKFQSAGLDDEFVPVNKMLRVRPDVRLGAYYHTPGWFVGLSVHNLIAGSQDEEGREFIQTTLYGVSSNPQGYLMAGALLPLGEGLLLRPSFLIGEDFDQPTTLDLNSVLIFNNKLWTGLGYRTKAYMFTQPNNVSTPSTRVTRSSSLNAIFLFAVNSKFRVGYSYDHQLVNKVYGGRSGSHEVTLGISFGKEIASRRYF